MTKAGQRWITEFGKLDENGDRYYYDARHFDSSEEADAHFKSMIVPTGERAYLEYADEYTADILAVKYS